jgi:hypothetical protein
MSIAEWDFHGDIELPGAVPNSAAIPLPRIAVIF